jgi:hypothetical protein
LLDVHDECVVVTLLALVVLWVKNLLSLVTCHYFTFTSPILSMGTMAAISVSFVFAS